MLTLARNWHWKIFLRASQRIKIIDHREIYESLRWIISDSWILVENFCEKLENKLLIQFLSMLLQLKSCWNFFFLQAAIFLQSGTSFVICLRLQSHKDVRSKLTLWNWRVLAKYNFAHRKHREKLWKHSTLNWKEKPETQLKEEKLNTT